MIAVYLWDKTPKHIGQYLGPSVLSKGESFSVLSIRTQTCAEGSIRNEPEYLPGVTEQNPTDMYDWDIHYAQGGKCCHKSDK